MSINNSYIEKLEFSEIYNLAEFIVKENQSHHSEEDPNCEYKKDVASIYDEESKFHQISKIYVNKDIYGNIRGSIRILKWNRKVILPLQKLFEIDPLVVASGYNEVYHIGRFAVAKEVKDIKLFKKLMVYAIVPLCVTDNNIAFAECDRKLLRILPFLKMKYKIIGKSIIYLGSETIPIAMTSEDVMEFYNENKSLISKERSPIV